MGSRFLGSRIVAIIALCSLGAGAACGGPATDSRIAAVIDDPGVVSPLNHLLGVQGDGRVDFADQDWAAQEATAACMAEAGFHYEPVIGQAVASAGASEFGDRIPTRDEVAEHGYGVADAVESGAPVLPDTDDPNGTFRASLSADERLAYDEALTGINEQQVAWNAEEGYAFDPATGEPLTPDQVRERQADGCLSLAYAETTSLDAEAVAILASHSYSDLQFEIMTDPRMIDLQIGWGRCMATMGYRYRSSADIVDELAAEAAEIDHEAASDHHDVTPEELAAMVADLRAREQALAVADWDCSQDLFAEAPEITREYEVEFIAEHEATIVQILDGADD